MPLNDKDLPIGYVEVLTKTQMSKNDIKAKFPNVSFSSAFQPPEGYAELFEGPQATGGEFWQYSQSAGVEQINGKWYTKYVLGPVFTDATAEDGTVTTAAENEAAYKAMKDAEQAKSVRTTRGEKLKECDWTQVLDAPVDQTAWAAYRQALRDVTAQEGFPWTIEWPTQPE